MRKYTSRQLQAQKTKLKIYNTAVHLFDKNGFDNTTIEDISKTAGVSVGAFYHYYASKTDIYCELFKRIDVYYENIVEPLLWSEDCYENIILFFKHYAIYNSERGLDAVKQLYGTLSINSFFLGKDRYMYQLLHRVLTQAQEQGKLVPGLQTEDALEFLYVMARGIIHDWMLHEGEYNMEEKMVQYITMLRPVFMRENDKK